MTRISSVQKTPSQRGTYTSSGAAGKAGPGRDGGPVWRGLGAQRAGVRALNPQSSLGRRKGQGHKGAAKVERKKENRVARASCGEGPWRGHIRRGAPDLAHKARLKRRGHTHSVPPGWPRPGSGRAGTAGPHTGRRLPRPGGTGPPSTPLGTGSCRKEHRGARTSRGHTWRDREKRREDRPRPPRCPTPASALGDAVLSPRRRHGKHNGSLCLSLQTFRVHRNPESIIKPCSDLGR